MTSGCPVCGTFGVYGYVKEVLNDLAGQDFAWPKATLYCVLRARERRKKGPLRAGGFRG